MRKIGLGIMLLLSMVLLMSCMEDITIDGTVVDVNLVVGQTHTFDASTANENGLSYEVMDESILSIDENVITALNAGQTTVKISAQANEDIFIEINVNVTAIVIDTDVSSLTLKTGESGQVTGSVNNGLGVSYESEDEDVFTVDSNGEIVAVGEGEANLIVSSTYDQSVSKNVLITVRKIITIDTEQTSVELFVGETISDLFTSNDELSYESALSSIASVDETGEITAVSPGMVTITATSLYDDLVSETISIIVGAIPETLTIDGPNQVILGSMTQLVVTTLPNNALDHVTFASDNTDILTINEDGQMTAVGQGTATITATSKGNTSISSTLQVEVLNDMYVDQSKSEGSTLEVNGFTYEFGINLFADIADALLVATDGTSIHVKAGTYESSINISLNDITLEAVEEVIITEDVMITGNHAHMNGFVFNGASITVTQAEGITLLQNTFNGADYPINLDTVNGHILIKHNQIENALTAVTVTNHQVLGTDQLEIVWNTISANQAFAFEFAGEQALMYARFNDITFTEKGAVVDGLQVDMTFNYWGSDTIDSLDFTGVEEKYLIKNYVSSEDIVTEDAYDSSKPLALVITNPIEEIWLGEPYDIEFEALPYEYVSNRYSFITGNAGVATVTATGIVSGVRSGLVTITVRYLPDTKIKESLSLSVTTEPGIEIIPSQNMAVLTVGEPLTLSSTVFPYTLAEEQVVYESNHPEIAYINEDGSIHSIQPGVVTFTAMLFNDMEIKTTYTIEFYDTFDQNNLMDLLTQNALNYTPVRKWVAVGVGYNYTDIKYDSVNRYYFSDFEVNTSKLLPVYQYVRPGYLHPQLPEGLPNYNPENIYWVVIHDTASTIANSGALAHANYLWNETSNKTTSYKSWHYTIDDTEIYQHVPDEEYAYHAGDGSTLPYAEDSRPLFSDGDPLYGGGNRSGIGIETSVSVTYDTMEVWHRTAKFASYLVDKYNMPTTQIAYHHDFSGKNCPQTMRNAGLVWLFEEMIDVEYEIVHQYADWTITMESHNPEYIDATGRVIAHPDRAVNASYTITVSDGETTESRTFNVYLPGTQR